MAFVIEDNGNIIKKKNYGLLSTKILTFCIFIIEKFLVAYGVIFR